MSKAKMPLLWVIFTAMVFLACGEIDPSENVLTKLKIDISPKSINFGTTPLNSSKEVRVYLTNKNTVDICISWANDDHVHPPFLSELYLRSNVVVTLKPNEKLEFSVIFAPSTRGYKSGTLKLSVGPKGIDSAFYYNPLYFITDIIQINLSGEGI